MRQVPNRIPVEGLSVYEACGCRVDQMPVFPKGGRMELLMLNGFVCVCVCISVGGPSLNI